MDKKLEQIVISKLNSIELLIKVLMDELIDNDVIDFEMIMKRLDDIEKKTENKKENVNEETSDDDISKMFFGQGGDA